MLQATSLNVGTSKKYFINHDIMNCTADGVVANHLYSGRALGLSNPRDVIQLHPDLKPLWNNIAEHYSRIKLSYSRDVIWNLDLRTLVGHIGYLPSVFFFGSQECFVWGDHHWFNAVDYINSKNNFMSIAKQLNIDIPETNCFQSINAINEADIQNASYPCYLKAAISVSGVGIYRCINEKALRSAMNKFSPNTPVQIQEEIIAESFLNMQYAVYDGQLSRLACTEQILDGFEHQGNRFPVAIEPWQSVDPIATWLQEQGIQGVFGLDVAHVETIQGARYPVIECNPRFNGASYPTIIAQKLNIPEWSAISLSTKHRTLDTINYKELEFSPSLGKGIILVNWGTILEGKITVLIAGNKEEQSKILVALQSVL